MPLVAISPEIANYIVLLWLMVLGAVFGSFFNVVIYRLPAGKSLVVPPSHCPKCGKPIRWNDNVPVISWIVLRGRCRDCRAPISIRYPLIEAVTAAIFVLLGWMELLSGGINLPLRPVTLADGVVVGTWSFADLCAMYAYHLVLICTLFCAAVIEWDDNRPAARLFIPAWMIGFLAPVGWPFLHPVPPWPGSHGAAAAAIQGALGLLAGTILGLAAWRLLPNKRQAAIVFGWGCVGLFLGWQAAIVLGLATQVIAIPAAYFCRRAANPRGITPVAWIAATTLVWIMAWAQLVQ